MTRRLRQVLPNGPLDLIGQVALWLGFVLAYQVVRGLADRSPTEAMENGQTVIDIQRATHTLVEPDLQRVVLESGLLVDLLNWTYWLSQFAVVGLALL